MAELATAPTDTKGLMNIDREEALAGAADQPGPSRRSLSLATFARPWRDPSTRRPDQPSDSWNRPPMRATSRRSPLTTGILLGALLTVAPSPGPVQADDPRHSHAPGPSFYRYDGDGRLERVERLRDRAIFRYDGDGALTGADRLAPRTRPRDGAPPDRPRPGTPRTDPFDRDIPEADVFSYDGDGDLTGATRRFPNLPDDRPPSARDPWPDDGS